MTFVLVNKGFRSRATDHHDPVPHQAEMRRAGIFKFPTFLIRLWILSISLLIQPPFAYSTTYYFSNSGNDTNSGTAATTPWSSLSEIYYKSCGIGRRIPFKPGDLLLLKAGETFNEAISMHGSGAPGSQITIGRYGEGENPTLIGDNLNAVWSLVEGRTNIYSSRLAGILVVAETSGKLYGQMPNLDEIVGTQDDWLDMFTNSCWGKLTAGGTVVFVRTADDSWPGTGRLRAFHKPLQVSGSYVTVENLNVRRAYYGISINYTTNTIVRNCHIEDTCGCGLRFYKCVAGEMASNTVTRTGWTSTYLGDMCISNRMHHNTISFATNTILGILNPFRESEELGGIGMKQGAYNIVEYNDVSHVNGFVDTYFEQGSVVRYNFFSSSRDGSGIAPHGTGWQVHNNIFNLGPAGKRALGGFWAYNESDSYGPALGTNLIHHNVFYGFTVYGFYSGQNYGPGVVLRNNIFVGASGANLAQGWSGPICDFNLYYCLGTPRFYWNAARTGYTLESYQAASGMETHSIYADPQFVSDSPVTAEDFRLRPTSPCINAGFDLKKAGLLGADQEYRDFLGRPVPQGAKPDIGVYETTVPAPPTNLR